MRGVDFVDNGQGKLILANATQGLRANECLQDMAAWLQCLDQGQASMERYLYFLGKEGARILERPKAY